jgi:hypothetical protein
MVSPATGAAVLARLRALLGAFRARAADLMTDDGGVVRTDATYWVTGVVLFLLAFALLLWAMFSLV